MVMCFHVGGSVKETLFHHCERLLKLGALKKEILVLLRVPLFLGK